MQNLSRKPQLSQTRATSRQGCVNLLETSTVMVQFYCESITTKCLTLKMKVKVMVHYIRNSAIRWQTSKSINIKYVIHFCASFHNFRAILAFQMFYIGNSQWCHSMAKINTYKSLCTHFYESFYRFNNTNIPNVWPWKFDLRNSGQGHRVQHSKRFQLFDLENLDRRE